MYYLLLLAAALLLAFDFAVNKLYQKIAGTKISAGLLFNSLWGLFTAIIFLAVNGFKCSFTVFSLIMAFLTAVIIMSYNIIGFRILKNGSMALYTLFLMTGGMTVPYIWGLLFLDETFSWLRTIGLLLIIIAIVLPNIDKQRLDVKNLIMCAAVFILNGFSSVVGKIHQTEMVYETVSAMDFVVLAGIMRFLIAGIAYIFVRLTKKEQKSVEFTGKKILLCGMLIVGSAVVGGMSQVFNLISASHLPATVLYPFLTGGSIILSAIAGITFFKERPSKSVIFGIGLCFVGTVMFL